MKFTGEFFIPQRTEDEQAYNPELEIEHKQRYLSILEIVAGKTVLDIACGEGYGSSILASAAAVVTGVDINPELVAHAGRTYCSNNLSFRHGSVDNIPLDAGSVDIIVSFETLEHVDAPTQQRFLGEVKRVLKPGGAFIVSTPNKKNYTDRYRHHNEFHVNELYLDAFEAFLRQYFGHIKLFEQGQEVTSVILNREDYLSRRPVALLPVNNAYHFEGKYLVALCSDQAETAQASIASMVPESEKSYFQLIDRIIALQHEVEELGGWGTNLTAEVESLRSRNSELAGEVENLGAWGTRQSDELAALAQEKMAVAENLRLAEEKIIAYTDIIQQLQETVAHANHKAFLLEAELEAVRRGPQQPPAILPGIDALNREITLLQAAIAGKTTPARPLPPAPRENPAPDNGSPTGSASREMASLQEENLWYRRTYEERSLLGVLRTKLAARFRK